MKDGGEMQVDLKKATRRRASYTDLVRIERLPPYSLEAEQGVLGCVLLSPNEVIPFCVEKLTSGADVFYDLRHMTIYREMLEMFDRQEAIDVVTLQQRLKDRQALNQVGGIPYLNTLAESVPSAANVSFYIAIILEKFVLRKMVQTCTDIVGRVYDFEGGEVDDLLDEVERDVLKIRQEAQTTDRKDVKDLVHSAMGLIEKMHAHGIGVNGLPTGFPDLDQITDGFHPGQMIVIAGRPSKGKTSLCMNIVEHVVLHEKLPTAVFSLEMTAEELMLRSICCAGLVNLRNIREGFMSEADFPKLANTASKYTNAPLYIDDTPGLSIIQLRARARRLWQEFGIKLFVIDYLQLLHSTTPRARDNRNQEIADISAGIKALAKELKVPVLVASQLNRDLEREKGRKPKLSDLRESGSIEQDADVVGLLYRPTTDDEESEIGYNPDGVPINLLIAKQRNGPTGDVKFTFLKPYTRFESAARVSDADAPN